MRRCDILTRNDKIINPGEQCNACIDGEQVIATRLTTHDGMIMTLPEMMSDQALRTLLH